MSLPKDQLDEIRKRIKDFESKLPELEKDIQDAQRAGIDVSDAIKTLNENKEAIRKLKLVYG